MRPAMRRAGGEGVFVDCDVQQICVEISGSFDPAREKSRGTWIRRRVTVEEARNWTPRPIDLGSASFKAGQFQGWIKGKI
jgi:hypothetical protein